MSKSRDIADSAATINFIDNLTSDAQTQLNTLDTAVDNISVTSGTLTKTFAQDEVATITLSSSITTPVVSVTKEVPQTGTTNSSWDVNSTSENYTRLNSAPATTLDFGQDYTATTATATSNQTAANERGVSISSDGTILYVINNTAKNVYSFTLSTAWDVTTATSRSQSNIASDFSNPTGVTFNDDGTKMYICDFDFVTVKEYALSTAWDETTASLNDTTSISGLISGFSGLYDLAFSGDGTVAFVCAYGNTQVAKLSLSTAFDMSSASFTSGDVFTEGGVTGVDISPDGKTLLTHIYNSASSKIYTLSTAYDITTRGTASTVTTVTNSGPSELRNGMLFMAQISTDVFSWTFEKQFTLGTGSFASADVGKTIEANSGKFVLTSTAGAYSQTTAPTSYAQVASGSWEMYGVVYNTTDGDLELSNLTITGTLVNASYTGNNFSVASQETSPEAIAFKPDGLSMYIVGRTNDTIYQYTLTSPFDITTASYASKSFTTNEGNPRSIAFSPDGTKMIYGGSSGQSIRYNTLSTAWDISTASLVYTFAVGSQDTWPSGIAYNADGTKMFMIGQNSSRIYEYSLNTPYVLDGNTTYTNNNFLASPAGGPVGMSFNSDGTKIFVADANSAKFYQFDLTSAYDITTASYSNNELAMTATSNSPGDLAVVNNNTQLMYVAYDTDLVYEYSLIDSTIVSGYHAVHTKTSTDTTYWTDINSMTADEAAGDGSIFYCVSTDDRSTWKIAKASDGERSIVRNNSGTWQYNSNGTYASTTWTNATTNTELNALQEAMTGATASVPYDLANSTEVTFTSDPGVGGTEDFVLSADGTRAYFLSSISGVGIYSSDLPSAFTGSGGSWTAAGSYTTISSQESTPKGLRFKSDGTKFYVVGYGSDTVYQYSMSTAWDVSTGSYDSVSFSVSTQSTTPFCISFSENGEHFYILDGNTKTAYQYDLTTAWDISTASYSNNSISLSSPSGAVGLDVVDSGTKMFVSFTGTIKEYSLGTAYDISTATVGTDSVSLGFTSPSIQILDNGGYMALANGSSGYLQDINVTTSYPNQMNKTQLDAVSDANHFTLANDLDLGIIFNLSSGTTVPSSDGVSINYDANVLNKGAILGTDYDFDAPAATKVRITALAANNLKVRVV